MITASESSAPGYPSPLGGRVYADGLNVSVRVPKLATDVIVSIAEDSPNAESGTHSWRHVRLTSRTGDVVHGWIPGVGAGTRHGIRVVGPWDPAHGMRFNSAKLLVDPYAMAVEGSWDGHSSCFGYVFGHELTRNDEDSAEHVPLSVVVDPADAEHYDWSGDARPRTPLAESVIYEVHVKGFTTLHPDVPEHLRGTYAGLAHPAAIDHLTNLGVTAVELLPVYETGDEAHLIKTGLSNYWGYNPVSWFAPRGMFSASGAGGSQVREFKDMVKALHAARIEVILDVVYNHTCEAGSLGPTLSWRGIDEGAYYMRSHNGFAQVDCTGCGNTIDATNPAAMTMILDSLRYWVTQMHVDGFRFDLAPQLARTSTGIDMLSACMSAISADPVLRDVKLIAEPWDIGPGGYQLGNFPAQWSEWNDRFRDAARDFWRGQGGGVAEIARRIGGSADIYAADFRAPAASINFVTAHDGFTLRDLVTYDHKHNIANGEDNRDGTTDNRSWNHGVEGETDDARINELRRKQMRNFLATLILSQGVPMLTAGDEFGRTQQGNNNAYSQDNEISWLDWNLQEWQQEQLKFTKRLLAIRKHHPSLRLDSYALCEPVVGQAAPGLVWFDSTGEPLSLSAWSEHDRTTLAAYLSGSVPHVDSTIADRAATPSFFLMINGGDADVEFSLPGAPYGVDYRRIIDTSEDIGGDAPWIDHCGAGITVSGRSMMLMLILA
ncbi:MAG: glycogen debranching protein GlgX [Actinomycetes bacterium]